MRKRIFCTMLSILMVLPLCGCHDIVDFEYPMFEDIGECEALKNSTLEGARFEEYDASEKDRYLKKLNYSACFAGRFTCDEFAFEIYAYEFADADGDWYEKYVAYAKENIHPDFDEHSKLLVQKYYLQWRRHYYDTNSGTMVTARQLEALMRLARASARARLSEVVVDEDVERAYKLAEYCINQFETQISGEKTEKVGHPENLKDEKTHEVLCTEFVKLSEDFDNKVPTHIFQKHMAELDFSKSFVEKWLRNMDAQEKLIMDVTSNQWSCIGEWYKKFI